VKPHLEGYRCLEKMEKSFSLSSSDFGIPCQNRHGYIYKSRSYQLADLPDIIKLDCGGTPVLAKYQSGSGTDLIVLFHGAADRAKREIPHFSPFLPKLGTPHQLALFDATLEQFDDLAAGWYLGWDGCPMHQHLGQAIQDFAKTIGCTNRVYVGGSSGGFAALLYSAKDSGSTAIAYNAQTNLHNHVYPTATEYYFSVAWPKLVKAEGLAQLPLDMAALWEELGSNMLIYLQSSSDDKHVVGQALPFLSKIAHRASNRTVVDCAFHGVHGHGGSIPRETVRRWVLSALKKSPASQDPVREVLDAKWNLDLSLSGAASKPGKAAPGFAKADTLIAERIARFTLRGH
jgi:hypothetical protein